MPKCNSNSARKNLILTAVGIGLQTAGTACLLAAAAGIAKSVHQQIKATISKELQKYITAE